MWIQLCFCAVLASTLSADDITHSHQDVGGMYARAMNDINLDADVLDREKRQALDKTEYHVTQCSYDNTQCCNDGASIQVLGVNMAYSQSVLRAAKLIHRMVRFMPRHIFVNLTRTSSIGLFSANDFPLDVFEEFASEIPSACRTSCNQVFLTDGSTYDCSRWCTTSEYPINPNYHLNFLWAYGNLSRTYVVETNVVCQGFNVGQNSENFLIREFGLTLMTRVLDDNILSDIETAYESAAQTSNWGTINNKYHYFMKATQIWFNGIIRDTGVMPCMYLIDPISNTMECENLYQQRQKMKTVDRPMFDILNYVFNDNREYLEGETSLCDW